MIADGKKQKLFMEEDDAVFQVTRAEEEKFFQETK